MSDVCSLLGEILLKLAFLVTESGNLGSVVVYFFRQCLARLFESGDLAFQSGTVNAGITT